MQWILFTIVIVALLAFDLLFFHRKAKLPTFKESLLWSLFWIGLALSFNAFIYFTRGEETAVKFLTGYLIEKTLSIDNIFVFILIFQTFLTPPQYIYKILFWGVLGAILLRGLFIAIGITLISHFHFFLYILGLFLIYGGIKIFFRKDQTVNVQEFKFIKFCKKVLPITETDEEGRFFVRKHGKLWVTPLFLTLLTIEFIDVIFALDSIPAIFAITLDPFIVYTSNIFAMLGLRSLYFVLASLIKFFHYLHYSIALLLVFVGIKMLLKDFVTIPTLYVLAGICLILGAGIILSLLFPKKNA